MTTRTRLIFSKRGGACFVPHIALAQIFSRSALRAGLKLVMTQGFSPHAKISFGPELPAGVVALNEPVDMYFDFESIPENFIDIMNFALPEGFKILQAYVIPDDSPSLGKLCKAAKYFIRANINLELHVKNFYGLENIISLANKDNWLELILQSPSQNPIGGLVKNLIRENLISGWQDINIVRDSIGIYKDGSVSLNA